ncbi:MAG: fatty acid desaturase family protein [Alphaproteobacteria bacterium]
MTVRRDYSLNGAETVRAFERGLVSADWYKCDVPRKRMKELMQRSDWPGLWWQGLWFALVFAAGALVVWSWGTWWLLLTLPVYGTLITGSADSRWHECGHRTCFKTNWLNDVVYQFACFFLYREPDVWRWSHVRHHTDTIIVGRDPEIITPRPPDFLGLVLTIFNLKGGTQTIMRVFAHAAGKVSDHERDFIPESDWNRMFWTARVWIAIWAAIIAWALIAWSLLPIVMFLLPQFYGHWLVLFFGMTQHIGLADDVLDHRLNTRTVYMNPVFRYLYSNMNYHIEHHMFPMVPFHALPALHEEIKADCPPPYPSTLAAYREIFPALIRQHRNPDWWVDRKLPPAPPGGKDDAGLVPAE